MVVAATEEYVKTYPSHQGTMTLLIASDEEASAKRWYSESSRNFDGTW